MTLLVVGRAVRLCSLILCVICPAAEAQLGSATREVEESALFAKLERLATGGQLGEADAREALKLMSAQANRLEGAGRWRDAVASRSRALALAEAALGPGDRASIDAEHSYGDALSRAGEYTQALRAYERVLTNSRKIGIADSDGKTLATLTGMAGVQGSLGQYSEAELAYRQILKGMASRPPQDPGRISVLNNLSEALLNLGRPDEALAVLEEVVQTRVKVLGAEDPLTLVSRSNVAGAYLRLGKFKEALRQNEEVAEARKRRLEVDHPDILKSRQGIATSLDYLDRLPEARDAYLAVLADRERVLGSLHPDTLLTLRALAGVLGQMKDFQNSRVRYDDLIARFEAQRTRGAESEDVRRSRFMTYVNAYKYYARILAEKGDAAAAFRIAELSKARTLLEVSHGRDAVRSATLTQKERSALQTTERAMAKLTDSLTRIENQVDRAAALLELSELEAEFKRTTEALAAKYPKFAALREIDPKGVEAAASLIGADTVFLNYLLLDDAPMVVWVDSSGKAGGAVLNRKRGLGQTIEAYRAALSRPGGIRDLENDYVWRMANGSFRLVPLSQGAPKDAVEPVHDIEVLRNSLSSILIDLLPRELGQYRRWIVSPDGALALVPFETLLLDAKPLIETKEIVYAQSFSMLGLVSRRAAEYQKLKREPMLVVGNPTYDASATSRWQPLPGAARELEALKTTFKLEEGKTLFAGPQASEATLMKLDRSGALSGYRNLVFAAHGFFDGRFPMESGLVLSQLNVEGGADGVVKAREWVNYELRSDLLVVSACESGVGRAVSGEGLLGLPFAFFVAGNTSSVLSLWPVYDDSTAEFMRDFLLRVQGGKAAAEALTLTKRDFASGRKSDRWKSPTYWAPFVLHGHSQ